jgi:hypothetical protein
MPCSNCRQSGHNKTTCPSADTVKAVKAKRIKVITLTTAKWPKGATHHTGVPIDLWAHCVTLGLVFKCLGYHIPVELRTIIFEFAKPMPLPYIVAVGPPRKNNTSFTWGCENSTSCKSALRGLNFTMPWYRAGRIVKRTVPSWGCILSTTHSSTSYTDPGGAPVISAHTVVGGCTAQYLRDMVGPDWRFTRI